MNRKPIGLSVPYRKPEPSKTTDCSEAIEELETENRLLRARNDRLEREVEELRAKGLL
jgi:predicted RNase H-like nuclease (RuvC/YqgF family)